jgi:glucosyl-3-phosphoglycerate phosphatase
VSRDRRLVLVRHGRTAWNDAGRAQGHADVELDAVGHAQAEAAAPALAALRPSALWTSDLARARQTCGYLERATGLAAKVDERLREYDVGARQGMVSQEFRDAFPEAFDSWVRGEDDVLVPGAESTADVVARMVPALRECLGSLDDGETGIVVTHGACLKDALFELLGWSQQLEPSLGSMDNCAWAVLVEHPTLDRLRLTTYNQQVTGPDFASAEGVG